MGKIQSHALTYTIFLRHTIKRVFECGIHYTPERRQVKMTCDVPHLYQLIPIHAEFHLLVIIMHFRFTRIEGKDA